MFNLTTTLKTEKTTQAELARLMNANPNSIAQWCTGNRTPTLANLIGIADALNLTLDQLAGRESEAHLRICEACMIKARRLCGGIPREPVAKC